MVRELLLGPQRFSDLESSLAGIGPNTLAARLRQMEADGLVEKRRLPTIIELGRWGRRRLRATIGDETFTVRIHDGAIEVDRGAPPDHDAAIRTDSATLLALGNGTITQRDAIERGVLHLDGDEEAARAWFRAFSVVRPVAG